jgi:hypothetical protein
MSEELKGHLRPSDDYLITCARQRDRPRQNPTAPCHTISQLGCVKQMRYWFYRSSGTSYGQAAGLVKVLRSLANGCEIFRPRHVTTNMNAGDSPTKSFWTRDRVNAPTDWGWQLQLLSVGWLLPQNLRQGSCHTRQKIFWILLVLSRCSPRFAFSSVRVRERKWCVAG